MRITTLVATMALCLSTVVLVGCGSGGPEIDQNYIKTGAALLEQRRGIVQKVNGKWSKLSAEDKKAFIDTYQGNEARAKFGWLEVSKPKEYLGVPFKPGTTVKDSDLG